MASVELIIKHRNLWLERINSGSRIEKLVATSLAGCREAVDELSSRLEQLGYPAVSMKRPSVKGLDKRIAAIEKMTSVPVPSVVREFWREVGGISLIDVNDYAHVAFWDDAGVKGKKGFCDGLHVDYCDDEWKDYTIDDFEMYSEDENESSFLYSLAPDGYHKDDISGGSPYSVGRNSEWLPTWENFEWSGYHPPKTCASNKPDFMSYLRTSILECGGFPGLLGHSEFEPIRIKLTRGLHPF